MQAAYYRRIYERARVRSRTIVERYAKITNLLRTSRARGGGAYRNFAKAKKGKPLTRIVLFTTVSPSAPAPGPTTASRSNNNYITTFVCDYNIYTVMCVCVRTL